MFKNLKKFAVTSSLLVAPFLTTTVVAEEREIHKGFYTVTSLGLTNTTDIDILGGGAIVFDNGVLWNTGLGYDFGKIRTEITYDTTTENIDTVQGDPAGTQVETRSIYATAYYDFRSDKKWQPYIGLGIGSAEIKATTAYVGNITLSAGDTNITSAIFKLGVTYSPTGKNDFFIERSGQGFNDFTIGNFKYTGVGVGSWTTGIRIKF